MSKPKARNEYVNVQPINPPITPIKSTCHSHMQARCDFDLQILFEFILYFVSGPQSTKSRDRKSSSKEKKDILSFDQIKEQRERERQRQREREIREVERRRFT